MDDFDLDNLIAEIQSEPKKPAPGQGAVVAAQTEFGLDDIDAFIADIALGGAAASAQSSKKAVIKRSNKYTATGAAHGNELDALLENLDPKNVDLSNMSKGTWRQAVVCAGSEQHIRCASHLRRTIWFGVPRLNSCPLLALH